MSEAHRIGPALPGVTEVEVDGQISVYAPATQQVVILNDTASDVWRLADGDHDLLEMTQLLANAYGVDVKAIREDVASAVRSFVEAGLIRDPEQPT